MGLHVGVEMKDNGIQAVMRGMGQYITGVKFQKLKLSEVVALYRMIRNRKTTNVLYESHHCQMKDSK